MSHRPEQIASLLHRAIQDVIAKGLHDPRASGLITITGVEVSRDLRSATVLVSVFPEDRQKLTMHALQHASRHIRRQVSDMVALKQTPDLNFRLDMSLKKQAEVFQALSRAQVSTPPNTGNTTDSPSGSPPAPDAPTEQDA